MRRDGQLDRPWLGLVRQEEESEFEDKLPSMLQWSVRQRSCKSRLVVAWPGPAGRPPLHPALFSNPRWCRRRCRCRQAGQLLASLIDLAASTSDKASTSPAWPDHPRSLSWARRAGQSQPQPACGAVWRAVVQWSTLWSPPPASSTRSAAVTAGRPDRSQDKVTGKSLDSCVTQLTFLKVGNSSQL